jgi:hypothetical protein
MPKGHALRNPFIPFLQGKSWGGRGACPLPLPLPSHWTQEKGTGESRELSKADYEFKPPLMDARLGTASWLLSSSGGCMMTCTGFSASFFALGLGLPPPPKSPVSKNCQPPTPHPH